MSIPGLVSGNTQVIVGPGEGITYNDIITYELGGGDYNSGVTTVGPIDAPIRLVNTVTGEVTGTVSKPPDMPTEILMENGRIVPIIYPNETVGSIIGKSPTIWSYKSGTDPMGRNWDKPYTGNDGYVGINPQDYAQGTLIVDSSDYPSGSPSPVLEAVINGERAVFVGKKACEDAKELVILEGKGEFYGDSLLYMLTPRIGYIGEYNCHPCDLVCCLAGCTVKDYPPIIVRVHKPYWRVWAFATIIYDIPNNNGQKYESINSNVVVVRSNFLPLPFDISYITPGATHVRYWSKNEIMFCEPDLEPPCPWDCGTEFKIGGDGEFYLRDEVEIPQQYRKKVGEL